MSIFLAQSEALFFHLTHIAGQEALFQQKLFEHVDTDTVRVILDQAASFSEESLAPLAASGDREGCRFSQGAVALPAGTTGIYQEWCSLGFPALGLPTSIEGMGFPRVILSAVQELCDGANLALGMMFINLRCAALALLKSGSADQQAQWIPGLVDGSLTSTIVISEPQAGSDVGRIRTLAEPQADGSCLLSGSKIWISYGDHDATPQILHLVLARMPGSEAGSRGLSLFAVPKLIDGRRNGITVSRVEHKMGLHASPTCVLDFQQSRGELVGEAGRGLQALFVMMNAMRLAVAVQGAGVANAATLQAIQYASERPQGGHPLSAAVPITHHADVQRMLLEMTAESELMRALALRTASMLDRSEAAGPADEQHWQALAELILPIAKTCNAEAAFTVVNQGIQVMGGYGYTNDYPLERMARDIRVAAIYEGTSGIQALDLQKRKIIADQGTTLSQLLALIDADLQTGESPFIAQWKPVKSLLNERLRQLLAYDKEQAAAADAGAYAFLQLTALALHCWNGHSLYVAAVDAVPYQQKLRSALEYFAGSLSAKAALWATRAAQVLPASAIGK
jgi:alkylation response protein AidB-like acyl-CoA dehydrogenase